MRWLRGLVGAIIGGSVGVLAGLIVIFTDLPIPSTYRGPALMVILFAPIIFGFIVGLVGVSGAARPDTDV